jgi:hypothetical protein
MLGRSSSTTEIRARVRKAGRKGLKVAVQVTATAGGKAATVTKTMTAKL